MQGKQKVCSGREENSNLWDEEKLGEGKEREKDYGGLGSCQVAWALS